MIELEHKPSDGASLEGAGGSPLDEMRAAYEAISSDVEQTRLFDVEGVRAAVRYRRKLNSERLKIVRQARERDSGVAEWEVNAQFLIESCEEILFYDPETGEPKPLIDGQVVTFAVDPVRGTMTLASALGVEERDARRSVLRLFQGVDDALLRHAEQVDAWMSSVRSRADREFAGG